MKHTVKLTLVGFAVAMAAGSAFAFDQDNFVERINAYQRAYKSPEFPLSQVNVPSVKSNSSAQSDNASSEKETTQQRFARELAIMQKASKDGF